MYLEHYGLKEKPFQISTDPRFLWLGEKHKEALATLKYGILDNKGFLLLTGDVGTGKTTLINSLLENLEDRVIVATVPDPGLEKIEFFNYIAHKLSIRKQMTTKGDFLVYFSHFLHAAYNKGKQVLLIIDEAQRLSQELLEEIRLLSNIENQDAKLINIFFIGQNEFNDILWRNNNRAIRQRMTLNYNLKPLSEKEVDDYVRHRLRVAGTQKKLFSSAAIREIFLFSGGYPRQINIICDHALLSGFVKETQKISVEMVKECAEELRIPEFTSRQNSRQPGEAIAQEGPTSERGEFREFRISPKEGSQDSSGLDIVDERRSPSHVKKIIFDVFLALVLFAIAVIYFSNPQLIQQWLPTSRPPINNPVSAEKSVAPDTEPPLQPLVTPRRPAHQGNTNVKEESVATTDPNKGRTGHKIISPYVFPSEVQILIFNYNSTALTDKSINTLDTYIDRLQHFADFHIRVTGFADQSGNPSYNAALAEFRATSVKTYLIGKGIAMDKITVLGSNGQDRTDSMGSDIPPQKQRRVEVQAIQKKS